VDSPDGDLCRRRPTHRLTDSALRDVSRIDRHS
jgi:hypothetical protein